jgi:hypothetical protein
MFVVMFVSFEKEEEIVPFEPELGQPLLSNDENKYICLLFIYVYLYLFIGSKKNEIVPFEQELEALLLSNDENKYVYVCLYLCVYLFVCFE